MILLMEDSFFYKLFILFILEEAGGILCDYREQLHYKFSCRQRKHRSRSDISMG